MSLDVDSLYLFIYLFSIFVGGQNFFVNATMITNTRDFLSERRTSERGSPIL